MKILSVPVFNLSEPPAVVKLPPKTPREGNPSKARFAQTVVSRPIPSPLEVHSIHSAVSKVFLTAPSVAPSIDFTGDDILILPSGASHGRT